MDMIFYLMGGGQLYDCGWFVVEDFEVEVMVVCFDDGVIVYEFVIVWFELVVFLEVQFDWLRCFDYM